MSDAILARSHQHRSRITGLCFRPLPECDMSRFIASCSLNELRLWDFSTSTVIMLLRELRYIRSPCFSHDGWVSSLVPLSYALVPLLRMFPESLWLDTKAHPSGCSRFILTRNLCKLFRHLLLCLTDKNGIYGYAVVVDPNYLWI